MTRREVLGVAAAGFLSAACSVGRAGSEEGAEIRDAVDRFYELARRRDWDAAGALLDAQFRIFVDGAESFDKPAYVQLLKADDIEVRAMELQDVQVHAAPGSSTGWCRFHGYFETVSQGTSSRTRTAETLVFEKRGREWRIVHAHASIKELGAADRA